MKRRFLCLLLGSVALSPGGKLFAAPGSTVTATVYVGRHFEVRDHDEPVKYVFNGATRIASITGSLSDRTRIQRLRLFPGWNLVSVGVTASNLVEQLGKAAISTVSVYQWNSPTGDYIPVNAGDNVPAGTVLWIKTATNQVADIGGTYNE
ncbi:MAG TPA: hypothetical protein VHI52_20425, partial [Verrucomicrobiae bacterium]|nr:hypothetical protein [Verrucomicrobiae bacterium]